jgi:hypothetical protein
MRLLISALFLCLCLNSSFAFMTRQNSQAPEPTASALTNKDILDMLGAGLTAEIVIVKIKSSKCNFDTSPNALKALKAASAPDAVILAMVQAPVESEGASPTTVPPKTASITKKNQESYPELQHIRKVYIPSAELKGYWGKLGQAMAKKLSKDHCITVTNGTKEMPDALLLALPYQTWMDKALNAASFSDSNLCVSRGGNLMCTDGTSVKCDANGCVSSYTGPMPETEGWQFILVDPQTGKRTSQWVAKSVTFRFTFPAPRQLEEAVGCRP